MADMKPVTITATTAQYKALRKMSLKYSNVSVEGMAEKLFSQIVRNYANTEAKKLAENEGKRWDSATKAGFDTKCTREEYIKRSMVEMNEILSEL